MATKKESLSDEDYRRLADFRHALRGFLEFSASAAAAENLTPQQHQALLAIRGNIARSTSVGFLAERLKIRSNTAAELSQRLEQAGLIKRIPHEGDRRTTDLVLTPAAEAKLEKLSQAHRRELSRVKPDLLSVLQSLETPKKK